MWQKLIALLILIPSVCFADLLFYHTPMIKSVTIQDNGTLEVVTITPSMWSYPEGGSPPGIAIKYIYAAKDGKIYLKEKIDGKYYPETLERKPETIEFDH